MPSAEPLAEITGREGKPEIRGPIPGTEGQRIVDMDHAYVATTTKTAPIVARQAKGSVVLGVDGNVFLDFASGIGVMNTGHGHPRVVQAVQEQAARLAHFAGTDFYYEAQALLAKRLTATLQPQAKRKVFFANSGTEANEAAIKISRWSSKRPQFLAFQRGFHGRTMGALALTSSKPVQRARFYSPMPGVHTVPFPDPYRNVFGIDGYDEPDALIDRVLDFVEGVLSTQLPAEEAAACFAEPIQGEGGYVFPPTAFFARLHKLLQSHGILLVADEVQTGFGRTGRMFAMEHYGVDPEITTMAKAMASGYPMGAAVFRADLDFGVQGAHSNTFGGNLISCAAALATLDVFEKEDLLAHANRVGDHFARRLSELKETTPCIGDARGLGLIRAIDFVVDPRSRKPDPKTRNAVVQAAIRRGLILLPAGPSAIRLIPPLVVTVDQVDGAVDVLAAAIKDATG